MSYFPPWDEPVTRLYDEDMEYDLHEQERLDMTPAERNLYDILHSHVETTVRYAVEYEFCAFCIGGITPDGKAKCSYCTNGRVVRS